MGCKDMCAGKTDIFWGESKAVTPAPAQRETEGTALRSSAGCTNLHGLSASEGSTMKQNLPQSIRRDSRQAGSPSLACRMYLRESVEHPAVQSSLEKKANLCARPQYAYCSKRSAHSCVQVGA